MRSRNIRLVLIVLLLAGAGLVFAQVGGFLGGSAEPSALSRVVPLRVELAEDSSRVRLLLGTPQTVAALGVLGPVDGRLTVWAEEDGVPVPLAELETRAA
ncbi:MAG TPA: hypothetical protein VFR03_15150, partial [Thermoanaerobaculia bacterium]|nr:hypothetical protein [Thermoanaerobaculia bacterium]